MFRKAYVMPYTQGYDETMTIAEDYDLWVRLAEQTEFYFEALPDVLIRIRDNPEQKTSKQKQAATKTPDSSLSGREKVYQRIQQNLGIAQPNTAMHTMLALVKRTKDPQKLEECGKWMQEIFAANEEKKLYDCEAFRSALQARWVKLCFKSALSMPKATQIYTQYRLSPVPLYSEVAKSLRNSTAKRFHSLKARLKHYL